MLFDNTKMDENQINYYVGEYSMHNIPSIVINGEITKKRRTGFKGTIDSN